MRHLLFPTVVALAATGASLAAQEAPTALTDALDTAAAECAAFEGGVLTVPDDAPREVYLGGGDGGWVLDFADLSCSSMASFGCGTGGCRVLFAVGDHVTERFAAGWTVVAFGVRPVVLLDVHGSRCGGANPTPCVEALVWDGERGAFSTLAKPAP